MDERIGYLLKRAQQTLRLVMDTRLRSLELTTAQYAALSALEQTPQASNAALARACFVTPQTMIEIIKGLEAAGFVSRKSHPEHGRIIQTILTASGSAKLTEAHRVVNQIEVEMLTGVNVEDQKAMAVGLRQCFENLER